MNLESDPTKPVADTKNQGERERLVAGQGWGYLLNSKGKTPTTDEQRPEAQAPVESTDAQIA